MIYQPNLRERLDTGEAVFLECFHRCVFIRADDPRIEGVHLHTCYEIYVNLSGDVSFLHGQTVYRIQPGDVVMSRPGEFHHCIYHSDCDHDHYCLWFTLPKGSAAERCLEREGTSGLIRLDRAHVASLLEAMNVLCGGRETEELERIACFYRSLSLLCRGESEPRQQAAVGPLGAVLDYVNVHFAELYSVREMADAVHISAPTLTRWFREQLQLSPYRYLTAKKLASAEALLRQGRSVTDACYQSGFTDCSRFIELFKKTYGITPLQYQKGLEGGKI